MSRKSLIWIVSILATAFILIRVEYCSYAQLRKNLTMESVTERIVAKFKNVEHITTDDLAASLDQADPGENILLVDARTAGEFEISHLPGARNLETVDELKNHLATMTVPPERIVVYCSVGYRSAELASRMEDAGTTGIPVQNLLGSIFSWANEDRPLVKGDKKTAHKVHPFNAKWGRLLEEKYRADLTDDK